MSPLRRKRERGPELPPDAGSTAEPGEAPAEATEGQERPKQGGLKDAIKESLREAALRRTSTKR